MSNFGNKPEPLESVTTPTVDTARAAYYLGRQPQTLRHWASAGTGDIQPQRINGRLAWPVAEIRNLLGVKPSSEPTHGVGHMQGRGAA